MIPAKFVGWYNTNNTLRTIFIIIIVLITRRPFYTHALIFTKNLALLCLSVGSASPFERAMLFTKQTLFAPRWMSQAWFINQIVMISGTYYPTLYRLYSFTHPQTLNFHCYKKLWLHCIQHQQSNMNRSRGNRYSLGSGNNNNNNSNNNNNNRNRHSNKNSNGSRKNAKKALQQPLRRSQSNS